jgi:hypothetical protein
MVSLIAVVGCSTPPKQQLTTVGPLCTISWDKTNDPKVTWYQVTVIDLSGQQKNTVRFIPADTTKISCKDAGADHEGLWDVAMQSCYGKTTCGPSTTTTPIRITTK